MTKPKHSSCQPDRLPVDCEPRYYHDPAGRKWRAREKRIAELMQQHGGDQMCSDRTYCELVYDHEEAPWTTDRAQLTAAGFDLPRADSLDDTQLTAKLAELIDELDRMHVCLSFTDHLTDRELYRALVEDALTCERRDIPMSEHARWHVDLSGYGDGGSIEDYTTAEASPAKTVSDRDNGLPGASS